MTKAVFTTKVMPGYKDLPEARYHFPRTYLNQVKQSIGDHIVYYEPRRSSTDLSSRGGRQTYFAVARVIDLIEDNELAGHFYAVVDNYLDLTGRSRLLTAVNIMKVRLKKLMAAPIRVRLGAPCELFLMMSSTAF
jgi:hypothetical protein